MIDQRAKPSWDSLAQRCVQDTTHVIFGGEGGLF